MVEQWLSPIVFLLGCSRYLIVDAFSLQQSCHTCHSHRTKRRPFRPSPLSIIAPPGSGYIGTGPEDEQYYGSLPDTYKPLMGYPGTMRPGMTPENVPFQDLPIGDDEPDDPVPWPHFQQIQWHHRWSDPPHESPGTMEDIIEAAGKWATPEQEALMRAGVRRGARALATRAAEGKRESIITDDEEDDEKDDGDADIREDPLALGEGMFGTLGSDEDRAATVAVVDAAGTEPDTEVENVDQTDMDDSLDDFLLDLGLDLELDDAGASLEASGPAEDDGAGDSVTAVMNTDGNQETSSIAFDLEDDEDTVVVEGDEAASALEEDISDSGGDMDGQDNFLDEAGFDFDDGGDFDFDDPW